MSLICEALLDLVRFINNLEEARKKYKKQSRIEISIEEDIMKIYQAPSTGSEMATVSPRCSSTRGPTSTGCPTAWTASGC